MLWWDSRQPTGNEAAKPEDPCNKVAAKQDEQNRSLSCGSASSGGSSSSRAATPARSTPCGPHIPLQEVQRFQPRRDGSWEDHLLHRWTRRRQWPNDSTGVDASGCPAEYIPAWRLICLDDSLMSASRVGRTLDQLQQARQRGDGALMPFAGTVSDVLSDFYDVFEPSLLLALKKAFRLRTDVAAWNECRPVPVVAEHSGNFFDAAVQMWASLPLWKKPVMSQALRELLATEDPTGLQVILGMMKASVRHCNAGKVDVWSRMLLRVKHSDLGVEEPWKDESCSTCEADPIARRQRARHRLWEETLAFADDWKEKALSTVFLEPTKMYYIACGERELADNVEVHATSVYLSVLLSTLGVRCARAPYFLDTPISAVSFLDALDGMQLAALWQPENFGKPFAAVPGCSEPTVRGRVPNHYSNFLFNGRQPWQIANSAVDPNVFPERRRKLVPYLIQFAWYFSEQFLLPRLTQHLLERDETRDALQVIYDELREEHGAAVGEVADAQGGGATLDFGEEDVRLWLWDIEVFPAELRTNNAAELLRLAGILKVTS